MATLSGFALSQAQVAIEAVAIVAFALSGLIEAARKRLDAVGVVVVAGLTAFGGGTLRDVLLDRRPFFWVQHANWLWALLVLCVGAMLFMRARHFEPTERAVQWPDALGLGLFAAGGTQVALAMQMPAIVAVLMGMVTAVFGGVLRDVVCNEIPQAFSDHRPYALCAFAGGWALVGGPRAGLARRSGPAGRPPWWPRRCAWRSCSAATRCRPGPRHDARHHDPDTHPQRLPAPAGRHRRHQRPLCLAGAARAPPVARADAAGGRPCRPGRGGAGLPGGAGGAPGAGLAAPAACGLRGGHRGAGRPRGLHQQPLDFSREACARRWVWTR
jgi:uncharacterized membrane protein YeiH